MLKRFIILGLVLLLAGSAALGWVLAEKRKEQKLTAHFKLKYDSEFSKELRQYDEWLQLPPEQRTDLPPGLEKYGKVITRAQLQREQQARLKADLDKLAAGDPNARPLAEFLYGENWQEEISHYKGQEELRELVFNGSVACASIGGAILTWCLLLYMARLGIGASSRLGRALAGARKDSAKAPDKSPADAEGEKDNNGSHIRSAQQGEARNTAQQQQSPAAHGRSKNPLKRLLKANRHKSRANRDKQRQPATSQPHLSGSQEHAKAATADPAADAGSPGSHESQQETAIQSDGKNTGRTADSPRKRRGKLARRIELTSQARANRILGQAETEESAQRAGQVTGERSDPVNGTLVDLAQQMAAIREYASTQQDRVKKLQEGYDWNIIKNFCMRVIRCLDNLDNRIRTLSGNNGEAVELHEIRDELLFALESSGIEQFEPEINSDYHGQEKHAEAVKERESCDDPALAGKIAKVVRPGYQYFIDDENVRIVRPAMVMLFSQTC